VSSKLFCANLHAWYGEHADGSCPVCGKGPIGLVQVARYKPILTRVENGIVRSVAIHGYWGGYGLLRIVRVILGEFLEVLWAVVRCDIHGRDGVIAELRDLAVVCVKGIERLQRTKGGAV
jgi:hypothetical protein